MEPARGKRKLARVFLRAVAWIVVLAAVCTAVPLSPAQATEFDLALDGALFGDGGEGIAIQIVQGQPPAAEVAKNGRLYGYLFSTDEVSGSVGYSGQPIDIHVALTLDGKIAGARIATHQEPILVIGITTADLNAFVSGFVGLDIRRSASISEVSSPEPSMPDVVAGASVSSAVMRDAIFRSARAVAHSRGLFYDGEAKRRLDRASFEAMSWQQLLSAGAVSRRVITRGEVAEALQTASNNPAGLYSELNAALLTPPKIGQNLLGQHAYEALFAEMGAQDNAILVAANGLYSYKGTAWRRSGVFDRIEVVQGANTIRLSKDNYRFIDRLQVQGGPEFREIGAFKIPAATGFDPVLPWRLYLLVARETDGGGERITRFALDYRLADAFLLNAGAMGQAVDAGPGPVVWKEIWRARTGEIILLAAMLMVLSAILIFQDALARRFRLYVGVRTVFLAFTLLFIGLYAGAQLSVVNVITFAHAFLTGFRWDLFLLNPLIFILWGFVAVAMLFWGRGVFCGWLCPFGALQEFIHMIAGWLKVRQIEVPWALHERLWPIKYIIFLGIGAASLQSLTWAFQLAEAEPFKTAIIMKFARPWPFGLYVLLLLTAGLFIERFFCRYLCPLGAALAMPARMHMFDWLKRRHQCGRECKICATRCTVQAIHPMGNINPNECIHCLRCQATYYDANTCLALKMRQARRQPAAAKPVGGKDGADAS
ncbi:MAG: regulatory protein NosR [Alphaproteobacteria bacterium]|nr:regulatory protein NosR [Alphaproteobacteria bacterium]